MRTRMLPFRPPGKTPARVRQEAGKPARRGSRLGHL